MFLDPVDLVQRTIRITGKWEQSQADWLKNALTPGQTYVDVGANVGYFALLAARRVGTRGTVLAIEPSAATAEQLVVNAERNDLPIRVERCACTSEGASGIELFLSADSGQTSLAAGAAGSDRFEMVRAKTLDDIVEAHGLTRLDVLKIDVEGAEYQVLSGARRTLSRFHPRVMIELEPENLKHFQHGAREVVALLREHGYVAQGGTISSPDYLFVFCGLTGGSHQEAVPLAVPNLEPRR